MVGWCGVCKVVCLRSEVLGIRRLLLAYLLELRGSPYRGGIGSEGKKTAENGSAGRLMIRIRSVQRIPRGSLIWGVCTAEFFCLLAGYPRVP